MSAPRVIAGNRKLNLNEQVLATSLFSTFDPNGDVISRFRFRDGNGALGGQFVVNGSAIESSNWFEIDLADITNVFFKAAGSRFTETLQVQVFDGSAWSNAVAFGLFSGTPNNNAPTLAVTAGRVVENEILDLRSLFTYSDANNDPVVRFKARDNRDNTGVASGYFVKNGTRQIQKDWFYFTESDSVHYVAAPGQYQEGIQLRAFDGTFWTNPVNTSIRTERNANRPVVAPLEVTVKSGRETAITDLFVATDADENTLKSYSFRDTHDLGGFLQYKGQAVAAKTWITLNQDQLQDLVFVGAPSYFTESLFIRVNDGQYNSNLGSTFIRSVAVPVLQSQQSVLMDDLQNRAVAPLFRQTDPGPRITEYKFIHDAEPNATGFFTLNGQRINEGQVYTVSPTQFSNLVYRSGRYEQPSLDNLLVQAYNGEFSSSWTRTEFRTEAEHYSSLIVNYDTPAELSWELFLTGSPLNLTYSFFNVYEPGYEGAEVTADNFVRFGVTERVGVREMLEEISTFANITFTEVPADSRSPFGYSGGDLRFGGMFIEDTDYAAFAYLPSDPITNALGGDVWVNYWATSGFEQGGFGYVALMHEIGHALGLKHPHEAPATLPELTDNAWNTVMTYVFDRQWARDYGTYDILSLQRLYGRNTSFNSGDDVYRFAPDPAAPNFLSIWDTGGNDTLDLSSYNRFMQVDLRSGAKSQVFANGFFRDQLSGAPLNSENINIAFGTDMENVIAGSRNDRLIGNNLANVIEGRAGNDTIRGMGANDLLKGGAGDDTYLWELGDGDDTIDEEFSAGRDRLVIDTKYTGIDSFSQDISFSRLGNRDLLIELTVDGGDAIGSVHILYQQGASRVESLVLQGMTGGDLTVDLTTFIADLGNHRTSLSLTGASSDLGRLVGPIV